MKTPELVDFTIRHYDNEAFPVKGFKVGMLTIHKPFENGRTWTLSYDGLRILQIDCSKIVAHQFLLGMAVVFADVQGRLGQELKEDKVLLGRLAENVDRRFKDLGYERIPGMQTLRKAR